MTGAPQEHTVTRRPLRFLIVGGWNTLFGYLVMIVFTALAEHFGGSWRWAVLPGQLVAATNGFFFHRTFVFPDMPANVQTFLRYNANSAGMVLLGIVEMYLLIDLAGLPSWVVITALLPVNTGLTYLLHRRVTFVASASDPAGP